MSLLVSMDNDNSLTLRDTANGLAIRAALLTLGGLFIGGWITALGMKRWNRDDISEIA